MKELLRRLTAKRRPDAPPLALASPLRVAIVGTGKAAHFHARALAGIHGARLACFVNRGSPQGAEFAAGAGVPIYRGIDEALERGGFDAVIVAVSWEATAAVARKVLATGIPCLIEKPLGSTTEEASAISDAGRGKLAFVAYNLRFQSSVAHALDVVDAFGEPSAVHIDAPEQSVLKKMNSGGRTADVAKRWLVLNTTHAIDLFTVFFRQPMAVTAMAAPRYFEGVPSDHTALLQSSLGGAGLFSSHWRSPGAWTLHAYGPDYRINLNLRSNTAEVIAPGINTTHAASQEDTDFKPGVLRQDYYFLQSVAQGACAHRNLASLESGVEAVRNAEALLRGSANGA